MQFTCLALHFLIYSKAVNFFFFSTKVMVRSLKFIQYSLNLSQNIQAINRQNLKQQNLPNNKVSLQDHLNSMMLSFCSISMRFHLPLGLLLFNGNIPFILCYLLWLIQVKQNRSKHMCFLKFLHNPPTQVPILSKPSLTPFTTPTKPFSLQSSNQQQSQNTLNQDSFKQALLNCLKVMDLNSRAINQLDYKLEESYKLLHRSNDLFSRNNCVRNAQVTAVSSETLESEPTETEGGHQSCDDLTVRLFGTRSYKYRLVLTDPFPQTIYKDRNFSIRVKLMNLDTNQLQNNGNMISICLNLCDSNGEWINQAKEGGSFLKGKLQTELYHGFGQFIKISSKDISRNFPNKKVNLVIDAKPSLLRYSGQSSIEYMVDHKLIEPLLIKDIAIKAKKRQ